jgi:hypothetical protein
MVQASIPGSDSNFYLIQIILTVPVDNPASCSESTAVSVQANKAYTAADVQLYIFLSLAVERSKLSASYVSGGKNSRRIKLTNYFHLLPKIRMSRAVPLLQYMPYWLGQRQPYLNFHHVSQISG